jgi:hypothetical protein
MTDMQVHLKKIRSDAAECLMLSSLATTEKREIFVKIAEHLNRLASEVERTMAIDSANVTRAEHRPEAVVTDQMATENIATDSAAAHHQQAARPRRLLLWLLVVVLGGIIGALFWADNPTKEYWFSSTFQSKHETSPAPKDEIQKALATFLSDEQAERKVLREQLSALAARVDDLVTALNDLRTARADVGRPSNKEAVGAEGKPPTAEIKPSTLEESPVRREENRNSTPENPAAAKPSDGAPRATDSPLIEPVQSIPILPRRADFDPRRPIVGPHGCTQFRSFDPVSGTYTTFDGRRRQCQ